MKIRNVVLSLAVTATIAMVTGCSSPADREAKALKRGNEFLAAGNLDKARIEYRNALQLMPNDAEARYRNGVVSERRGDLREAAQYYFGATESDPKHDAARRALARLLVSARVPNEAIEVIDAGLDQHENDPGYLALRAAAKAQINDREGALADAALAYKNKPDDERVVAVYAGILAQGGNKAQAREVLENGARLLPQSADLRLALASLEADENHDAAERWLRAVVAVQPKIPSYRVMLAQFLSRIGRSDSAEQEIREARKMFPEDTGVREGLVRFLIANRSTASAEAELRGDADEHPQDDDRRLVLATFLVQTGAFDRAIIELDKVIKHSTTGTAAEAARARLASIAFSRGDLADAERRANEVLERNPRDPEALLVRGNVKLQREDARGAVEDLRTATRDVPDSVPLLVALGRAHAVAGDAGLAEEAMRRAVELGGADPVPAVQLTTLLLAQGRPKEARDVIAAPFRAAGPDQTIEEATLRAALGSKDHGLATEVIARVRRDAAGMARADFYAGLMAVAEGHRDEAVRHYIESVRRDPAAPAAVAEAVKLLLAAGRRDEALRLLEDVIVKAPQSGAALVLKADLYLSGRDFATAEPAYREALKRQPKLASAQRGLAYVILGKGDVDGAVRTLDEYSAQSDNPGMLLAAAGQLLELSGRRSAAIAQYDRALGAHPGDAFLRAKIALLLVADGEDAQARKRAGELVSGFAESPNARLRDAYAWVGYKSGDGPGALRLLEQLGREAPDDAMIHFHLGAVRAGSGDVTGAVTALRTATSSAERYTGDAEAKAMLAQLAAKK